MSYLLISWTPSSITAMAHGQKLFRRCFLSADEPPWTTTRPFNIMWSVPTRVYYWVEGDWLWQYTFAKVLSSSCEGPLGYCCRFKCKILIHSSRCWSPANMGSFMFPIFHMERIELGAAVFLIFFLKDSCSRYLSVCWGHWGSSWF